MDFISELGIEVQTIKLAKSLIEDKNWFRYLLFKYRSLNNKNDNNFIIIIDY